MEITFKFWRKHALLQQRGWIQATHTDQIQSDTHFVIFLPAILIAWNFLLVVAWFLYVRYPQFLYMPQQHSCYVQNFIAVTLLRIMLNFYEIGNFIEKAWNCPNAFAGTFQLIPHKLRAQLWPGKFVGKFRTKMFRDLSSLES